MPVSIMSIALESGLSNGKHKGVVLAMPAGNLAASSLKSLLSSLYKYSLTLVKPVFNEKQGEMSIPCMLGAAESIG